METRDADRRACAQCAQRIGHQDASAAFRADRFADRTFALEDYEAIIQDEINVKRITIAAGIADLLISRSSLT